MEKKDLDNWQKNPISIRSERVQYWMNGIMITLLSREDAQSRVRDGRAFVISSQAIGVIRDGKTFS